MTPVLRAHPVIMSAMKDLADRSDTGRAAGVRSFVVLRVCAFFEVSCPAID
jgi:hypothetical protein